MHFRFFPTLMSISRTALAIVCSCSISANAQVLDDDQSVARNWNEVLLSAIRSDFARPTVHARNLFHSSALMYDLWAVFDEQADTYFLGKTVNNFNCEFYTEDKSYFMQLASTEAVRNEAISFAIYRLLQHRFESTPGSAALTRATRLMNELGYDPDNSTVSLEAGGAELGNYAAECMIEYGLSDGSNETNDYLNNNYTPINPALDPSLTGTPGMEDPNRWQPLQLDIFIDQSGNETSTPLFLSAEWGRVSPFAMTQDDFRQYTRDSVDYWVYHDPGSPALLDSVDGPQEYQWNHSLVSVWSSHLDPSDGVMCDISPASIGNSAAFPESPEEYKTYFDSVGNGCSVTDQGHQINPATGQPYQPQIVPRGDYARVLAEFWADGPDSETPPGHWFTVVNEAVSDHPELQKRYKGIGDVLSELEWDVKVYFTLGAAMHDAAVSAWGIKGWYDYVRPISAIRYMSALGQSGDATLDNYNVNGLPLIEGKIEVVQEGDALAGNSNENVGKIKLFAWRGPDAIDDERTDVAGVGWILADNWWPYQRPSFVTPPFAGYVSGHSTFSRAAAEILTAFTGDEFFPGGMGEFTASANEFLVFEDGPSVDIILQWATYRDASDQTSLSRIWGGIHPPIDDIPGRKIGIQVAEDVMAKVDSYFTGQEDDLLSNQPTPPESPAPSQSGGGGSTSLISLFGLLFASIILHWSRRQKK